ncbi:glycoside hydrolase family 16 protein [bacterium]|nr:MAG: glycoside hydrolase family 16 protein [bacterium]
MKLVWSDEFDKDGAPDPKNWGFETGYARNEEDQWYQSDNAMVKDGLLVIEAKREQKPNPTYKEGSTEWRTKRKNIEFTSSSLSTNNLHSWTYGRFEMRARIPVDSGLWPAFWTVGQTGEWPKGGEIDIMEFYRGKVLANIAWGTDRRWNAKWNSKSKAVADWNDPQWAQKFHVWAMDWDAEKITLSVDGEVLNTQLLKDTVNSDGTGINPFNSPQFIILNLALGGQNGGDLSKTTFPQKYEVDYVRVYQKG